MITTAIALAALLTVTPTGVVRKTSTPVITTSQVSPSATVQPTAKATVVASLLVVESKSIRVLDGDTIEVKDGVKPKFKLRLRYVDCPESKQPGGPLAATYLRGLIDEDKTVTISVVGSDMYNRSTGDLTLKNGDAAYQLVAYGYCLPYRNGKTLRGARDMAVRLQRGPYWDGRWRGWCGDELGRVAMKSGATYCRVRDFTNYNKTNCSMTTGVVSDEVCISPDTPAWIYRKSLKEIQAIGKGLGKN